MNYYVSETFDIDDVQYVRESIQRYVNLHHVAFCAICFHGDDFGNYHVHIAMSKKIDFILLDDFETVIKLFHNGGSSLQDFISYMSFYSHVEYLSCSLPDNDLGRYFEVD